MTGYTFKKLRNSLKYKLVNRKDEKKTKYKAPGGASSITRLFLGNFSPPYTAISNRNTSPSNITSYKTCYNQQSAMLFKPAYKDHSLHLVASVP